MKVGSLFSGIGGMDLGLERAGMEVIWQVEIDSWCRRVLAKHWPGVRRYDDIKTINPEQLESVDLLCGGFPCQPASQAGKRKGTADERWLWPEFYRFIRSLRPRWVLVENVPGLLSVNSGSAFGEVLRDLASSGYCVEWDCIPAAAVGAPHRRDRVWIIAYTNGKGIEWREQYAKSPSRDLANSQSKFSNGDANQSGERLGPKAIQEFGNGSRPGSLAYADEPGLERFRQFGKAGSIRSQRYEPERDELSSTACGINNNRMANSDNSRSGQVSRIFQRSPFNAQRAGFEPQEWAIEPDVGRVVDGVPRRVDRLRGLGNAVVPQVVEFIGRRIMEIA